MIAAGLLGAAVGAAAMWFFLSIWEAVSPLGARAMYVKAKEARRRAEVLERELADAQRTAQERLEQLEAWMQTQQGEQ